MENDWHCGGCSRLFGTKREFIQHYRKEHPDAAWTCFDQCEDVGDAFANKALKVALGWRADAMRMVKAEQDLAALKIEYNKLALALNSVGAAIDLARHAL